MTRDMPRIRIALIAAVVAALTLVPVGLAGKPSGGSGGFTGTGCSISPRQVVLDQVWTVSAWGLPAKSGANMILTFPSGDQISGAITPASNGTISFTGNSNMSASWGFIAPEQKGTYTYQFVGKMSWPAGTYTKLYAQCSVTVS